VATIDIWMHFRVEMRRDRTSWEEVIETWQHPEIERPSKDKPGRRVHERRMPDGSTLAVVGEQTADGLTLVTTWRK
jgi:hypothetical protein